MENLKENQGEKGLCKRREANPSRGENPEVKSWSSRMGVGHRASNPIPETQILLGNLSQVQPVGYMENEPCNVKR
jgi:hypothetical protein